MHINQQSAIHAILVVRSLRPSAKRYGRSSDFIARKMTDGRPLFLALGIKGLKNSMHNIIIVTLLINPPQHANYQHESSICTSVRQSVQMTT